MGERLITITGFTIMGVCLLRLASQPVALGRLLADVGLSLPSHTRRHL